MYWPGDDVFFTGTVTAWYVETGEHRVVYDDGDVVVELLGGGMPHIGRCSRFNILKGHPMLTVPVKYPLASLHIL